MASEAIRDPRADRLLTPQNSAFIIIDYQPVQVNSIASMDRPLMLNNIVGCAKAAVAYGLPIVHSTVNVQTGFNKPPVPHIRKVLGSYPTYDRTTEAQDRHHNQSAHIAHFHAHGEANLERRDAVYFLRRIA